MADKRQARIDEINKRIEEIEQERGSLVDEREQLANDMTADRVAGFNEKLVDEARELGVVPENFGDEKSLKAAVKEAKGKQ